MHQITNQRELRRTFWREHPTLNRRKIVNMGRGRWHVADTRMAFVDWLDGLARDGSVSEALAQRATL